MEIHSFEDGIKRSDKMCALCGATVLVTIKVIIGKGSMSTKRVVTSYGSRVGSSFKGIGIGALICVVAVVCLFKNEGRTIHETKKLKEGKAVTVSVDAGAIDPANEGKLIHIADDVVSDETLTDSLFQVTTPGLVLRRNVEVYQWQENQTTQTNRLSGGQEETITDYSYEKVWSSDLIDSKDFHEAGHDNPTSFPCESEVFLATKATCGAFSLTSDQIGELGPDVKFDPRNAQAAPKAEESAPKAPAEETTQEPAVTRQYQSATTNEIFAQQEEQIQISTDPAPTVDVSVPQQSAPSGDFSISVNGNAATTEAATSVGATAPAAEANAVTAPNAITVSNAATVPNADRLPANTVVYQEGFYIGNPESPQIGDARITFTRVTSPCPTSFVGQQHNNILIPYETKNGSLLLQEEGILSAETMFANAQRANMTMAWIIRLVGTLFIFIGFKMIFGPIEVIADFVPFASKLVGFGTSVIAICFTIFLALGTISVGWVYYRPLVGIPLLIVAVGAPIYLFVCGKKRSEQTSQPLA